jgi:glycerol dehydrogenase-like iron-containing ADH family enzyme
MLFRKRYRLCNAPTSPLSCALSTTLASIIHKQSYTHYQYKEYLVHITCITKA